MLIIHCDGGLVQGVCTDSEELLKLLHHHLVAIIDYDTEGAGSNQICSIKQGLDKDAECVNAYFELVTVSTAAIDLQDLRTKLQANTKEL